MRSLKKLVLPMDGWESSSKRRAVATALAGIDVGFVFRREVPKKMNGWFRF